MVFEHAGDGFYDDFLIDVEDLSYLLRLRQGIVEMATGSRKYAEEEESGKG